MHHAASVTTTTCRPSHIPLPSDIPLCLLTYLLCLLSLPRFEVAQIQHGWRQRFGFIPWSSIHTYIHTYADPAKCQCYGICRIDKCMYLYISVYSFWIASVHACILVLFNFSRTQILSRLQKKNNGEFNQVNGYVCWVFISRVRNVSCLYCTGVYGFVAVAFYLQLDCSISRSAHCFCWKITLDLHGHMLK